MPAVNLTGVPVYDGMIEGFLYVPSAIASWLSQYNPYDVGFWMGAFIFFGIIVWVLFGGD